MKLSAAIELTKTVKAGGPGSGRKPEEVAKEKMDKAATMLHGYGYTRGGVKNGSEVFNHPSGHSIALTDHERSPKMYGRLRDSAPAQHKVGFRPSKDSSVTRPVVPDAVAGYPMGLLKQHLAEMHAQ